MKTFFLSHFFKNFNPAYGNPKHELKLIKKKSLMGGDSCNTFEVSLENHLGTHIDGQKHFFENGKPLQDYEASFWIFDNPQILVARLL